MGQACCEAKTTIEDRRAHRAQGEQLQHGGGRAVGARARSADCKAKPNGPGVRRSRARKSRGAITATAQCVSRAGTVGEIVCCDLCPVSVHPDCIGITVKDITRYHRWSCPHHSCHECGRKAAAVGGILVPLRSVPARVLRRSLAEARQKSSASASASKTWARTTRRKRASFTATASAPSGRRRTSRTSTVKASEGWSIGKKVAITDHWIEERDAELELAGGERHAHQAVGARHVHRSRTSSRFATKARRREGRRRRNQPRLCEEVIKNRNRVSCWRCAACCATTRRTGENVAAVICRMHNDTPWEDIIEVERRAGCRRCSFTVRVRTYSRAHDFGSAPPPRKTLEEMTGGRTRIEARSRGARGSHRRGRDGLTGSITRC